MNIHLFMDPLGYYSFQFTQRITGLDPGNNVIININQAKITHPDIRYFSGYNAELKKWLFNLEKPDRVYYHYYNPIFQDINLKMKNIYPGIISVWSFWGGDFYSLPEFTEKKYLEFSKKAASRSGFFRKNIFRQLGVEIYYRLKGNVPYNHRRFIRSFKQIDFLATYFEQDFNAIVNYSGAKMKFVKFPYLSIDLILGDVQRWRDYQLGEKIMIGHSADPGLNHFEIIKKLNDLGCSKTLFLPMSYGDQGYKNKLTEAISKLNVHVEIIDEHLPLQEYNKKLLDVGYAVFNVNHQQAFGNIITLIWLGVKVFLHKESAIYKNFAELGVHIFSVDSIADMDSFIKLTDAEKSTNRKILEQILSSEMANEMNLKLVKLKQSDL